MYRQQALSWQDKEVSEETINRSCSTLFAYNLGNKVKASDESAETETGGSGAFGVLPEVKELYEDRVREVSKPT
jgi:hypothetical protein